MSELEAKTKAATQGTWVTSQAGHLNGAVNCGNRHIAMVNYCVCREVDKRVTHTEDNAEYIVSAQPSVMLAMIAELRKLKAMCEWLSENVRSEGDYDKKCPYYTQFDRTKKCSIWTDEETKSDIDFDSVE